MALGRGVSHSLLFKRFGRPDRSMSPQIQPGQTNNSKSLIRPTAVRKLGEFYSMSVKKPFTSVFHGVEFAPVIAAPDAPLL